MLARVGELPVGTRFVTGLTKRLGAVRAQLPGLGETSVVFEDRRNKLKFVSAFLLVEVVEQPKETVN